GLGGRARAQSIRQRRGALAAREGRGQRRPARRSPLQPRGRADRPRRRALAIPAGDRAEHSRGAPPGKRPLVGPRPQRSRRRSRRDSRREAALPEDRAASRRRCVIDTHAHLAALDDPDEAVERAAEAGVGRILSVGTDVEDCRRALALADEYDGVYAILGIHPHSAGTATDADLAELRGLLEHRKAVAVGETGLDWYPECAPAWSGIACSPTYPPPAAQPRFSAARLNPASELGKPPVIHTRAADDDT